MSFDLDEPTADTVRAAQRGDQAAQHELVSRMRPMIRGLADHYRRSLDPEDVEQECAMALLKAVPRYNYRVPWSTFAWGYILDAFRIHRLKFMGPVSSSRKLEQQGTATARAVEIASDIGGSDRSSWGVFVADEATPDLDEAMSMRDRRRMLAAAFERMPQDELFALGHFVQHVAGEAPLFRKWRADERRLQQSGFRAVARYVALDAA